MILFISVAAVTAVTGITKSVKAGKDIYNTKELYENIEARQNYSKERLELYRKQCSEALKNLGEEKYFVMHHSMRSFVDIFSKIKRVDFKETAELNEQDKFQLDSVNLVELPEYVNSFMCSFAGGGAGGLASGVATALGAYSLAGALGSASTGTLIETLSGAAASNATLAFIGGGTLATGGLGIAGGSLVLGGLVAGPALMVMGFIAGGVAGHKLEDAKANAKQATVACEQMEKGTKQCIAIRRRSYMFYSLLARLEIQFNALIHEMEKIIEQNGEEYRTYPAECKKTIAKTAALAGSIKAIIDTPILTDSGELTPESEAILGEERYQLT